MINKKIHLCWLSGDEYPPLIERCVKSWEKYLPDYEIVIWDRNKLDLDLIKWVKQAFENKKYAFAADYIRLYALYTEGGIYLDSDVEVFKSFNDLLNQHSFIGLETSGDFEPAIMGAEKGCEWIGKCLEYYKSREFILPDNSFSTTPLPIIVGQTLKSQYGINPEANNENARAIGLKIYNSEYFSPKSIHTKKIKATKNTIAVHHFDGAWVKKDFKFWCKQVVHSLLITILGQERHNKVIKKGRILL